MANYSVGDIIRHTRVAAGMTQEELCDGICSVQTLSRIENKKHKVKPETYQQLMARLERIPEKKYALCTGKDLELLEEYSYLKDMIVKFDYEKAEEYLRRIEEKIGEGVVNKQYLLRTRALLDFYNKRISADEAVEMLDEAIKLTVPEYKRYFEEEIIYPYTEQEIIVLMNLANILGRAGRHEEEIKIDEALLNNIAAGYIQEHERAVYTVIIGRNRISALNKIKRYGEIEKSVYKCYEMAKKYDYIIEIPVLLHAMARNIIMLKGDNISDEETAMVKKYLRQAYYISLGRDDNKVTEILDETYKYLYDADIRLV